MDRDRFIDQKFAPSVNIIPSVTMAMFRQLAISEQRSFEETLFGATTASCLRSACDVTTRATGEMRYETLTTLCARSLLLERLT